MQKPSVLIVLGSDSDLPVMSQVADTLHSFSVEYTMRILSAHRVPLQVAELASGARDQGYQAIIAGAGMAAHLPGVIAAYTTLPVIGVPLQSKVLDGQDALYSIVQMPPGVPVATVGIGAAKNAALLALQILGVHDQRIAAALAAEKERMAEQVLAKDARLQSVGYQAYSRN
jgi:5-(carboxyamino)imidazole ribonucleotide mutase